MVLCNSEILTRGKDTDEGKMHRRKKTGMKIENKKTVHSTVGFSHHYNAMFRYKY